MQLYQAKIRLAGNPMHEVIKIGLTAAEIMLLRSIHSPPGSDTESVFDVTEAGTVERSDADERDRLRTVYNTPKSSADGLRIRDRVTEVFGHDSLPLPKTVAGAKVAPVAGREPKPRREKKPPIEIVEPAEPSAEELTA